MLLMSYFQTLNPTAFFNALPGNIASGLIWGIMALGVFVTFRMLDMADFSFCPAGSAVADRYPNVCSCNEGAVADVIYKKIPAILERMP